MWGGSILVRPAGDLGKLRGARPISPLFLHRQDDSIDPV